MINATKNISSVVISSSSTATTLSKQAQRLQDIAEKIMLQDKVHRISLIEEMKLLIRAITQDELTQVVRNISSPVALNFLIPAGVYGEPRQLLFLKLSNMAKAK